MLVRCCRFSPAVQLVVPEARVQSPSLSRHHTPLTPWGVLAAPVSAQSPAPPTVSPNCRTDPVQLLAYFESGFALPQALADEFTKQFPNVTWDIRMDQFANLMTQSPLLLSGDNPPDLIRLPSMVSLATDGLLLNLDPYVTAYGWTSGRRRCWCRTAWTRTANAAAARSSRRV